MEDQYENEARMAENRGDDRLAADLYIQAVQVATHQLSDARIHSASSHTFGAS